MSASLRTETLVQPRRARAWRVIHACEYARDVLPVVEGQISAGMRPYIVTPQGAGTAELYLSGKRNEQPRSLSLLRSWQDVRNWRKSLLDCDPEVSSDLVHAHCFAAGMAGVRSVSCVVYDLRACIEEMAIGAHLCEPGSWMGRSFRVAEQFVLSRAAAVIVHSQGMKQAAIERSAPPENLFLVPDPIAGEDNSPLFPDTDFLFRRYGLAPETVSFFVPQFAAAGTTELSPAAISALEGFALAAHVALVHQLDALATMQSAHVVVALDETPIDPVAARQANEICLKALWQGKTLLAADVVRNRDATPEGRGCLWFEAGNPRDLGYRMAFLGRNPEFRAALGVAGRMYIFDTRNNHAIGEKYDEAYRHAWNRKKSGPQGPALKVLHPEASCG